MLASPSDVVLVKFDEFYEKATPFSLAAGNCHPFVNGLQTVNHPPFAAWTKGWSHLGLSITHHPGEELLPQRAT